MPTPQQQAQLQRTLQEIKKKYGFARSSGIATQIRLATERAGYNQAQYKKILADFEAGQIQGQREARNQAEQRIQSEIALQKKLGIYQDPGKGGILIPVTENDIRVRNLQKAQQEQIKKLQQAGYYGQSTREGVIFTKPGLTLQERQAQFFNQAVANAKASSTKQSRSTLDNLRLAKQLFIQTQKSVPTVIKDYAKSLGKGTVKVGLYIMDESGMVSQLRINKNTGKLYIPKNAVYISQSPRMTRVKRWADYDFKNNPFRDPDYQNVGIVTGLTLLGVTSPSTAAKVFGVVKGKAIWDAVKNPTPYNLAIVESLYLPEIAGRVKKLKARGDILVAESGELVPLKERIKQVDFLIKNSGKKVESITAKPSKTAGYTNIKSPKNIDYTYGNKIEFATFKVGKAYPTSEYFLKGKGTKAQRLLKTGRVNIEEIEVARVNKKYSTTIRKALLSKKGRLSESFIKKYYREAKLEANRRGKPLAVISPKRLRGFYQAEQEMIKILPNNYKPKKLSFAGYTETGHRVYTDQRFFKNVKSFVKSKLTKGKIERSYFKELAGEKLEYLKGRPAMKGEYAEHGLGHLTAANIDPKAKAYARKLNVKKFGNVFEQHDLAKVSDADSFSKFEHGKVLYDLWRKGSYPDKNIYKLPKKIQRQIMEAYAGHTPVKPRLIDSLKKGWKNNSVVKDLIWYAKNKRNPYLQDILTLDRLELPRAGRWNIKVNYKLLDKKALKRIYGSELNAVKNIRFLDWKTVPGRLKRRIGKSGLSKILSRDRSVLKSLKENFRKVKTKYGKRISIKKKSYAKVIKKKTRMVYPKRSYSYFDKRIKSYKLPRGYKKSDVRYTATGKPYVITPKGAKFIKYTLKKGTYKIPPIFKTPKYPTAKPPKYPRLTPPTRPPKYPPGKPPKRPPRSPPKKPPTIRRLKSSRPKSGRKKIRSYDVYARPLKKKGQKKIPRLIKVNKFPLSKNRAKDLRNYITDTSLSRTARLVPASGKPRDSLVKIPSGYAKKTSKKFRIVRIRGRRAIALPTGTVIEKNRNLLDTIQEKRGITLKRRISQINKRTQPRRTSRRKIIVRKKTKKKLTPNQKKILLERLKKARAVRMRNLKKRRGR